MRGRALDSRGGINYNMLELTESGRKAMPRAEKEDFPTSVFPAADPDRQIAGMPYGDPSRIGREKQTK